MSQEEKKEEKPKKAERPNNPFLAKQNVRQSILTGSTPPQEDVSNISTGDIQTTPKISLQTSIIDLMTEKKKKRNRNWDNQPEHQATHFRGVSTELRDAITEISKDIEVTASDVARAFLEYALDEFKKGNLSVEPILKSGKLTLFPKNGWGMSMEAEWHASSWNTPKPGEKPKTKNKPRPKAWQSEVSYRGIPDKVRDAIREISRRNHVPIGEVVSLFFSYAIKAYKNNQLLLTPKQNYR